MGSGEVEWRRGAAWAFQQAMGLVWYYRHSNPPMAALGSSTLKRLLDDPGVGQRPRSVGSGGHDPAVGNELDTR